MRNILTLWHTFRCIFWACTKTCYDTLTIQNETLVATTVCFSFWKLHHKLVKPLRKSDILEILWQLSRHLLLNAWGEHKCSSLLKSYFVELVDFWLRKFSTVCENFRQFSLLFAYEVCRQNTVFRVTPRPLNHSTQHTCIKSFLLVTVDVSPSTCLHFGWGLRLISRFYGELRLFRKTRHIEIDVRGTTFH